MALPRHICTLSNIFGICYPLPMSCGHHLVWRDNAAQAVSLRAVTLPRVMLSGLCLQEFEELDYFTSWPVLPTTDGIAALAPLHTSTLVWEPGASEAPASAVPGLQKLGIRWAFSQQVMQMSCTREASMLASFLQATCKSSWPQCAEVGKGIFVLACLSKG